jgi:hypothetical protein
MLVQGKPFTFTENPTLPWFDMPIPAIDPVAGFSGMSVSGPFVELDIELMVEFLENLFADYSAIVVAPASNLWIEQSDEVFLFGRLVAVNTLGQLLAMTLDGVCTRFDQGLEASSRPCVELAYSVLTHRETQEVEAACPFYVEKCVDNTGFLGVQFKTNAL